MQEDPEQGIEDLPLQAPSARAQYKPIRIVQAQLHTAAQLF